MDTSKLKPKDPRVSYKTANVRGKTYTYIHGVPPNGKEPIDTILLCHGFPDIAFGWRCQIPYLMSLGYQVICPNMMGYADTDAPQELEHFSTKSISADLKALVEQVIGEHKQIILGGHDWGGQQVFRMTLHYPELIKAIFSVCTPYFPPTPVYISLEDMVKTKMPNFAYQLQFAGPEVQEKVQGEEMLRKVLRGFWGGRGPNGEQGMSIKSGVQFENLDILGRSPLMSDEEAEHMVSEYMKQPAPQMRGPLNWYRTRELNWKEEKQLLDERGSEAIKINVPVLFVGADGDAALPPTLAAGMNKYIADLTKKEVHASHWALVQASEDVNKHIREFLDNKVKANL